MKCKIRGRTMSVERAFGTRDEEFYYTCNNCEYNPKEDNMTRCHICNGLGIVSSTIDETDAITIYLKCERCGTLIGKELRVEAKDYDKFIEELDKMLKGE